MPKVEGWAIKSVTHFYYLLNIPPERLVLYFLQMFASPALVAIMKNAGVLTQFWCSVTHKVYAPPPASEHLARCTSSLSTSR